MTCGHARVDAVTTLDGELVGAICIACLDAVPVVWLHMQSYADGCKRYARLRRDVQRVGEVAR